MIQRRRRPLAALTAGVAMLHLWLAGTVLPARLGDGAADARPRRIEVEFVRELKLATPSTLPARAPLTRRRAVAPAPAIAASAVAMVAPLPPLPAMPELPAPAAAMIAEVAAEPAMPASAAPSPQAQAASVSPSGPASLPAPAAPSAASAAAPAVGAQAAASAPSAAVFEWPPSTRLSYRLSGNFRGPVEGRAQVEWLRVGSRYQVQMELSIGPSFAPLMTRRASSEGEITDQGLRPRRYDEETRVVLREPRRLTMYFDTDRVRMPDGRVGPRPAGLQDSASQFVQLTWLFSTQPQVLQKGNSIDLPLALPRQIVPWTYDVLEAEILQTPTGPVPAVHVKPRREPGVGGDLTAELWVAPGLQYLPVRIVIRQDLQNYVDLEIERLPEQAEAGR